jgi:hypothetical protein
MAGNSAAAVGCARGKSRWTWGEREFCKTHATHGDIQEKSDNLHSCAHHTLTEVATKPINTRHVIVKLNYSKTC